MEDPTKDRGLQSAIEEALGFAMIPGNDSTWMIALQKKINVLITADFNRLILLLYRLDISEAKLKQLLREYPGAESAKIIAELIVERQLQKIESRKMFRATDDDISADEKW